MKKIKGILSLASFLFASLVMVHPVFAQGFVPTSVNTNAGLGGVGLNTLVQNGLTVLIIVGGIVCLAYLIIAGIKYITSGGDSSKTESARKQIIAALIGIVIILASFFLLRLGLGLIGLSPDTNSVYIPCVKNDGTNGNISISGSCV